MSSALDKLAKLHGVGESWIDFKGNPQEPSAESRAAILAAIGVDASDAEAVERSLLQFETMRWTSMAPPAVVVRSGEAICIPTTAPKIVRTRKVSWSVTLDDGTRREGEASVASLRVLESTDVEGRSYVRLALKLPALPLGYHSAVVSLDSGLSADVLIIVAPRRCHEAAAIANGARLWGVAVQLYSLKSERNWGVGDFRDLRELIELAAPLGCSLIGLNPLHALMPANPAHISPYSPSSRLFLNVLYVAVEEVEEFAGSEPARRRVAEPEFQATRT